MSAPEWRTDDACSQGRQGFVHTQPASLLILGPHPRLAARMHTLRHTPCKHTPSLRQVLIKTVSVGVNPVDVIVRSGFYKPEKFPKVRLAAKLSGFRLAATATWPQEFCGGEVVHCCFLSGAPSPAADQGLPPPSAGKAIGSGTCGQQQ